MYDGWHNGGWGPEGWLFMGLMMLPFWGLIVGVLMYVIRNSRAHAHGAPAPGAPTDSDPLRILDERFARGEIDVAEYNQRRELLRSR